MFILNFFSTEKIVTALERSLSVGTKLVPFTFAIVGPSITLVNVDAFHIARGPIRKTFIAR